MSNSEELIPELAQWREKNGTSFSIEDWAIVSGDVLHAIGYLHLFWPEFIVHDNCVFFRDRFTEENYEDWLKASYVTNYGQVERVINHVHILDLFSQSEQAIINISQVLYIGNTMMSMMASKLKTEFPEKTFSVTFNGEEQFDDFLDYQLTFWTIDNDERVINA